MVLEAGHIVESGRYGAELSQAQRLPPPRPAAVSADPPPCGAAQRAASYADGGVMSRHHWCSCPTGRFGTPPHARPGEAYDGSRKLSPPVTFSSCSSVRCLTGGHGVAGEEGPGFLDGELKAAGRGDVRRQRQGCPIALLPAGPAATGEAFEKRSRSARLMAEQARSGRRRCRGHRAGPLTRSVDRITWR